jgi:hypothetical protein
VVDADDEKVRRNAFNARETPDVRPPRRPASRPRDVR